MPEQSNIVISVTTYQKRIDTVAESLATLARQLPERAEMHLWLAEDDFPDRSDSKLVSKLSEIEQLGVEILWCDHTIGPHDKYYWEMREQPDATIITFDDDLIYPDDTISNLLEGHLAHPDAVIATRTHMIKIDTDEHGNSKIADYTDWLLEQTIHENEPRFDLLATGVGGILYPPRAFDERLLDEDAIRKTTLFTDDIWLYANELFCNVPVVAVCNFSLDGKYVDGTQEHGLAVVNRHSGGNDAALERLFCQYPELRARIISEARQNEISTNP